MVIRNDARGKRPTIAVRRHERITRPLTYGLMRPVSACWSIARDNASQTGEMSRDQYKPQVSSDDLH